MGNDYIKEQIFEHLCKEYQSLWLISVADKSMKVYKQDNAKAIPNSVDNALKMRDFDEVRQWYVQNFVVGHLQEKVLAQTEMRYILDRLNEKAPYYVEYGRKNKGLINYNQLCFDKIISPDTKEAEYVILGFRNIDIAKRAEIDDLTGVYTRQMFFARAEKMLRDFPERQFDLSISDIVDFKKINETYGSDVGDEILKWQGSYISTFMSEDLIIGRYGGDQLVMLGTHEAVMDCLSPENKAIFDDAKKNNGLPAINIKFGIYPDINHNISIIAACDKAHMALNSIKRHYNRSVAYYNDEIKSHLEKQRRIEDSMYESMRQGDFKVYYQPKHDAKTGKLVGAEALVRWIHPEYGFMNPGDFIPLFEQNGFIVENDRFVFRKTCENLKRWEGMGIKTVPISINASKLTMSNADVVSNMRNAVEQNGVSTQQLHIEVTETLMTDNVADLIEKLNEIRRLGFEVELDDFGSGYSSINILSTLPIDVLKLDMSFMQQFGDKKRSVVLESCIDLAKKLGFKTVSEGVEYKEQSDELGRLGVDMIQGYLYSKPLPENEFEKYMLEHIA